MSQKFKRGNLVRVAKDLGECMRHFESDCNAIVIGSYADQFSGDDIHSYTLFIEGSGETSWYQEHQLTFVRHDPTLLKVWKKEADEKHAQFTNLKWIVENWEQIKTRPPFSTILKIMAVLDVPTSFHRNGEYYCLHQDWIESFGLIDFILAKRPFPETATPDQIKELSEDRDRYWKKIEKEINR